MMDTLSSYPTFAVFITGLLGGVHCAGMCGGIVTALGMFDQRSKLQSVNPSIKSGAVVLSSSTASLNSSSSMLFNVSLYNLGRISTYTLIGALAGFVGSAAWLMSAVFPVQKTAFFISQLILIIMGLYVAGVKSIGSFIERLGKHIWARVKPHATKRLHGSGPLNMLLAGMFWGLVPCGMVYAVLSVALVSGGAFQGALLMLSFGLGTLPNLMLLGVSGQWFARFSKRRMVRVAAGLLIIAFGVMGLMHAPVASV